MSEQTLSELRKDIIAATAVIIVLPLGGFISMQLTEILK
jgi:hypothetical protein